MVERIDRRIGLGMALAGSLLLTTACDNGASQAPATVANESTSFTELAPPPGGTWTDVINPTDDGVMMGNPEAAVKLIEIASLGCPFCKRFEEEGVPALKERIASGKLSWEFRPYIIHGSVDLAANIIARCNGPRGFFPMMQALYRTQDTWMGKVQAAPRAEVERLQTLSPGEATVGIARLAGLQQFAAQRGLPSAKAEQCLSDQAAIAREVAVMSNVTNQFPEFKGTPGFALNGTLLPGVNSWQALQPALDAALK